MCWPVLVDVAMPKSEELLTYGEKKVAKQSLISVKKRGASLS